MKSISIDAQATSSDRANLLARGRRLEYLTIAWNSLEALISLLAGWLAGSIALVSFGLDSVIETASAAILWWRLRPQIDAEQRERIERRAHRLVGACFLLLAAYVAFESIRALRLHSQPERSIPGVAIACAAIIVMPLLARAKRKIARPLGSGALHSDSRQADFCAYLSSILLLGLMLNWLLGWWWADATAALVMAPIIAREGVQGLRGEACDDCAPTRK